jgi:hypothetical protein
MAHGAFAASKAETDIAIGNEHESSQSQRTDDERCKRNHQHAPVAAKR